MIADRAARATAANSLIVEIAARGRRFFANGVRVATLEVDHRGRVWFIDDYSGARIFTHYSGRWRGFTHGGTLKRFVERLRDFVLRGEKLPPGALGPWPEWCCRGDLWGYGADMEHVRMRAAELGLTQEPREELANGGKENRR